MKDTSKTPFINEFADNFCIKYKLYIERKVIKLAHQHRYRNNLFSGWLNTAYLQIYQADCNLIMLFGNLKTTNDLFSLPLTFNEKGYFTINTHNFRILPVDYRMLLKKRHVTKNGLENTITSLQRLIAANVYDLAGLEVHHIDFDITNNNISNLIPLKRKFHQYLHSVEYRMNPHFINFNGLKKHIISKQNLTSRSNSTVFKDDLIRFTICYYRYIEKLMYKDILKLKDIGFKLPSRGTMINITSQFPDFRGYYDDITSRIPEICTCTI